MHLPPTVASPPQAAPTTQRNVPQHGLTFTTSQTASAAANIGPIWASSPSDAWSVDHASGPAAALHASNAGRPSAARRTRPG